MGKSEDRKAHSIIQLSEAQPQRSLLFGQVLKEHRKRKKYSQQEFADIMNVTRNTIINWEADKSKPDYSYVPELCSLLDIRLNELFGMKSDSGLSSLEERVINNLRALSPVSRRVVDKMVSAMLSEESVLRDEEMKMTFRLTLVRPGSAAAGTGDFVPDEPPTYTFLRRNSINEHADGIVRVHGASMEPIYHDGDYVYYEETPSATPGEDVIVDTDDGAVIKRVDDDLTLYSVNPNCPYPAKTDDNSLVVRGRVLGTVHSSERASKEDEEILEDLFADEIREFNEEHGITE